MFGLVPMIDERAELEMRAALANPICEAFEALVHLAARRR
jgi:hypothetical protein